MTDEARIFVSYANEDQEFVTQLRKNPFGHTAEPWTTFAILTKLERAVGNADAAALARQQAIDAYLAYRRDGGENHTPVGRLALLVHQAITSGSLDETTAQLNQLTAHPNLPNYLRPMLAALRAILTGSRDPALASDPALDHDDAAELLHLLATLPRTP